jgi:hypothetical protein
VIVSSPREAPLQTSTGNPGDRLDLERLSGARQVATLRGRNRTKADIRICDLDRRRIVLKDYGQRPAWIRWTIGRFLVRRESAAYRTAGRIEGLAGFIGRIGPYALALEWIDGRPLAEIAPGDLPDGTIERLGRIVRSLHSRGIALVDLHHRDVLVGAGGSVHVVDLAAAWSLGNGGPLRRRLFERLRAQDLVALERMRARAAGENPDAAVSALGGPGAAWHRKGRRLKSVWDLLRRRGARPTNGE